MATLNQKEFLEWRKANPNNSFTEIRNGQRKVIPAQEMPAEQAGGGNIIENILKGFTDPFSNITRLTADVANKLTGGKNPDNLTEDEKSNMGRFLLKTGAGLASMAVPGGSTIAGNVGRSALSGALGSLGSQDIAKDIDVGELVKGGLLGGAIGGVASGIGKLASRGKKPLRKAVEEGMETNRFVEAGSNLRTKKFGISAYDVGGVNKKRAIEKTVLGELSARGLPTDTIEKVAIGLDSSLDDIGKQVTTGLANTKAKYKTSKLFDEFVSKLEDNPKVLNSATGQEVVNKIVKLGDNPTASKLHKFRQEVDKLIPDKSFQGTTEQLANSSRAAKTMRDIVSDTLKSDPKLGKYKSLLDTESKLLTAREPILKQLDKVKNVSVMQGVSIPGTSNLAQTASNKAGQAIQGVGRLIQGQGANIPGGKFAEILAIPAVAGQASKFLKTDDPELEQSLTNLESSNQQVPDYALPLFEIDQQALRNQALDYYISKGMDPTKAMAYVNFKMPNKPKLSASDKKTLQDTMYSRSQLENLKATVDKFGVYFNPIGGQPVFGMIGNLLTPERARAETVVYATLRNIAKGIEGKSPTDADMDAYKQFLPNLADTPDIIEQKMIALEQMVNDKEDIARGLAGTQGLNINLQQ